MSGPPAKRIKKIEAISNSVGPSRRAACAFDLESDDMPEELRCPICREVPLGEVVQCYNGHPICKDCQEKIGRECTQCRVSMKEEFGGWIRNKMVEDLLDGMWFACPFRQNGCKKTLSRGQVRSHQETCRFDPERVQICKYFKVARSCDYWTRTAKPEEALEHLRTKHLIDGCQYNADRSYIFFDVGDPIGLDYVEAVVIKKSGATYLTLVWSDEMSDSFSFACVRMDKIIPGQQGATKAELTLERQEPMPFLKFPNWKVTLPIVSVLEAPKTVLEHKPVVVSRPFLKKYLLKDQDPAPNNQVKEEAKQDDGDEEDSDDSEEEEDEEEECQCSPSEEDTEVNVDVCVRVFVTIS